MPAPAYTIQTVIIDCATNYGGIRLGMRGLLFFNKGKLLDWRDVDQCDWGSTSIRAETYYEADRAFTNSEGISTGNSMGREFQSAEGDTTNVRLWCTFWVPFTTNEIRYVNSHNYGDLTEYGAKDIKIYVSDQYIVPSDDYEVIPAGFTFIYDGTVPQHSAADIDEYVVLPLAVLELPLIVHAPTVQLQPVLSAQAEIHLVANAPEMLLHLSMEGIAYFMGVMSAESPGMRVHIALLAQVECPYIQRFKITDAHTIIYICTVTGAENGLPDIVVPISSFQFRNRSGTPSYLQAVAPGTSQYDGISARPDGDIVITMVLTLNDVIVLTEEIARVNMGNINFENGAKSRSVTMSGTKQTTYTLGKIVVPNLVVASSSSAGKRRVQMAVADTYINPGDTVLIDGVLFPADLITTTVRASTNGDITSSMEISES